MTLAVLPYILIELKSLLNGRRLSGFNWLFDATAAVMAGTTILFVLRRYAAPLVLESFGSFGRSILTLIFKNMLFLQCLDVSLITVYGVLLVLLGLVLLRHHPSLNIVLTVLAFSLFGRGIDEIATIAVQLHNKFGWFAWFQAPIHDYRTLDLLYLIFWTIIAASTTFLLVSATITFAQASMKKTPDVAYGRDPLPGNRQWRTKGQSKGSPTS
jgi:hypothetical protein